MSGSCCSFVLDPSGLRISATASRLWAGTMDVLQGLFGSTLAWILSVISHRGAHWQTFSSPPTVATSLGHLRRPLAQLFPELATAACQAGVARDLYADDATPTHHSRTSADVSSRVWRWVPIVRWCRGICWRGWLLPVVGSHMNIQQMRAVSPIRQYMQVQSFSGFASRSQPQLW